MNPAGAGIKRRLCALTPRRSLRAVELLAGTTAGGIWVSPPAALGNTSLTWTHPFEMPGLLCALPEVARVSWDGLSHIPRWGICSHPRSLTQPSSPFLFLDPAQPIP